MIGVMISKISKKLFSDTVYVQLSESRIRVCNVDSGLLYEQPPYIAITPLETVVLN